MARSGKIFLFFLLHSVVAPIALFAQTDDSFFQQFEFNFSFSPPGARPGAMGRTFVGLANDATAAITNPAGLLGLLKDSRTRTQVSFEFKSTDLEIERLAAADAFFTNRVTASGETKNRLSFFNVAVKLGPKFRAAFTRHESIRLEEKFRLEPRAIPELPDPARPGRFFAFLPSQGVFDLQGAGYAGSFAWAVTDRLSLGITVSAERVESKTSEQRFNFSTSTRGSVNPQDLSDIVISNTVLNQVSIDDKDTALGVIAGVIIKPKDGIHFGGTYSSGAKFRLRESFLSNPAPSDPRSTLQPAQGFPTEITLKIPDRWAFGSAFSPTQLLDVYSFDLLFAFDLVRVEYSDLLDDFTPVLSTLREISPRDLTARDFRVNDALEVHFGGELGLPVANDTVFLRAGLFTDPDHRQRYVGRTGSVETDALFSNLFKFPEESMDVGWTLGGGLTVAQRLQLDIAFVKSQSFKELVSSFVLRF